MSNLTLACHACNKKKGNNTAEEFGFPNIHIQAKQTLRDSAAVNITRWSLYSQLCMTKLPIEIGSGGKTKYNRIRLGLQKSHWIDAACIGDSTSLELSFANVIP